MERFEGFTAIYEPTDDGWIFARVLEVPGAFTQGRDMEEAREMLRDALLLMLEAMLRVPLARACIGSSSGREHPRG